MADLALDVTVNANLQAKRDNTRRRDYRDQRSGVRGGAYGYSSHGGSGFRGGTVGKSRDDRPSGGLNKGRDERRDEDRDSSSKVLISNLEYNVSDVDIKELFCEFGKTRRVRLNYDKSGRSMGTAEIIYEKRSDAYRAMQQYNGVPLDGKPMIIEIVGASDKSAAPGMRQYSRPVPYGARNYSNKPTNSDRPNYSSRRETRDPEKTAEELDKELDMYLKSASKETPEEEIVVEKPKEQTPTPEPEEEETPAITAQEESDILDADD